MISLSYRLQSAARDMIFDSGHFSESSQYHRYPESGGFLFRSHILDVVMDVAAENVSVFFKDL